MKEQVDTSSEEFKGAVEVMKNTYIDWLQNMQRDAYAQGVLIHPEVIMAAFKEVLEYYEILNEEVDYDELARKLTEG